MLRCFVLSWRLLTQNCPSFPVTSLTLFNVANLYVSVLIFHAAGAMDTSICVLSDPPSNIANTSMKLPSGETNSRYCAGVMLDPIVVPFILICITFVVLVTLVGGATKLDPGCGTLGAILGLTAGMPVKL